jgi:thymidylate synthase (FAD)
MEKIGSAAITDVVSRPNDAASIPTEHPAAVLCLDHGCVRLVDFMGSDLSVVRAARVSYNAAWRAGENASSDARLINYLWRNHHTTPFEAVTFTFEVKAPIFVLRQWMRHRTWSYNELSARYRELPEEFYVPKPEHVGTQSKDNKQGRELGASCDGSIPKLFQSACTEAFSAYRRLLLCGVPRELARSVLPLATYSHMFATVDLLNLLKFLTLRCHPHAQFEIRIYAEAMRNLIQPIVPVCLEAWEVERRDRQK